MLTMDDGELIDERIHVLTDNSTETYSVSIKTDDYLYPSKNASFARNSGFEKLLIFEKSV
jgi:hypothetical protein